MVELGYRATHIPERGFRVTTSLLSLKVDILALIEHTNPMQ
jgi:hypothetical protein